jgi:hypothetical protein
MLTRRHGIELRRHTLDDLLCSFSVLPSPRNLDEKFIKRRLVLDESVVQVPYDQQSLLKGFQEIFAVALYNSTEMGSNHESRGGSWVDRQRGKRTSTSCCF